MPPGLERLGLIAGRRPVRRTLGCLGLKRECRMLADARRHPILQHGVVGGDAEFGTVGNGSGQQVERFRIDESTPLVPALGPGIGEQQESRNVRIVTEDARLLLRALPVASIDRAFLLFPDPWPKRRHEGRRFVNPEALDLLARVLADGAEFRVATDHAVLQDWMPERIAEHPAFQLETSATERPQDWAPTRYEAKALRAGRHPIYLTYRRKPRETLL